MKIRYLKLKSWLLVSLGSLIGLQIGCSKDKEPDRGPSGAYGCPEAAYHVVGTVVNEEGEPIEGIRVGRYYRLPRYYNDTTGPDGRYDVCILGRPGGESSLEFDDIDDYQHGRYRDTIVRVSAPRDAFHGADGAWFEGTADVELDITLQRTDE
jgi:putative lipoprotein (rSAM/lipoprotein system)